jgi:hypothetical protein
VSFRCEAVSEENQHRGFVPEFQETVARHSTFEAATEKTQIGLADLCREA